LILCVAKLLDCGIVGRVPLQELLKEAHELSAIFTESQYTAKAGRGLKLRK
jgi:hypothetical protein